MASLARTRFASRKGDGIPLALLHLPVEANDDLLVKSVVEANQAHARKLGYHLEPFLVSDFKDGNQATRILYARGIQGIVLPSAFRFDMLPGMDWNRFSLVAEGEITEDPLHPFSSLVSHAMVDHFRSILCAWSETQKRGYKRIGFALFDIPTISGQIRQGAAHACLRETPLKNRIPPLVHDIRSKTIDGSRVGAWVRRHRPDAVIGFNGAFRWVLNQEGFRTPEDIAFCSLHKSADAGRLQIHDEPESGMKAMRLETAFAAIELLDQQIRHREFGLLPTSRIQLIQSVWIDGDSLPIAGGRASSR